MSQRHDIGWKKRNQPTRSDSKISGAQLARDLVDRGLASPDILETNHKPAEGRHP